MKKYGQQDELSPINEGWFKVGGERISDLESYIFNQFATKSELEVAIGTDCRVVADYNDVELSKRVKRISYLTVIYFKSVDENFRNVNHLIMRRDNVTMFGNVSTMQKLQGEIDRTLELAMWFRNTIMKDPAIHLDVNPKESEGSYAVYKYIKGTFEGLGFPTEYKPHGVAAMCAADFYA